MISVGIDVSKEKSTVCVIKPYGEIVMKPKDVQHTESELSKLVGELQELQGEIKVVMEATGYIKADWLKDSMEIDTSKDPLDEIKKFKK